MLLIHIYLAHTYRIPSSVFTLATMHDWHHSLSQIRSLITYKTHTEFIDIKVNKIEPYI